MACDDMNNIAIESIYIGKYQYQVKQKLFSQQGDEWVKTDGIRLNDSETASIKLDVTLDIKEGSERYKIENPAITHYESSAGGSIEMLDSDTFIYTPPANFKGVDEITYYMNDNKGGEPKGFIRINVLTDLSSSNIDVVGLKQGQTSNFNVLHEDEPVGVLIQEIVLIEAPTYGVVQFDDSGEFSYTPYPDHFGSDEFSYEIRYSDGTSKRSTIRLDVDCSQVSCRREFLLSWDPSISSNVVAYRVYAGRKPDIFNSIYEIDALSYQYIAREKGDFYFTVSAVNDLGIESARSPVEKAVF